jgi:hypothetical protein
MEDDKITAAAELAADDFTAKMEARNFHFIERDSAEWTRMWAVLASYQFGRWRGDMACRNEDSGEVWQYMGTIDGMHEFRHRDHPVTGCREYVNVPERKEDT